MGGDSGNMGNVENVKRVVFVGNPNVGKSSMFNALLGARTRTMNAPGTTVSITCGQYRYKSSKTTKIRRIGSLWTLPEPIRYLR